MSRLEEIYKREIIPRLMKENGYKNILSVPMLRKIVVNIGVGEAIANIKALDAAKNDLSIITGQCPIITKAKKSISNFKLREGMPIGCMVTLRMGMMYEFFDRLVNVALPRVRDFRGISHSSFDGNGNFTLGIRDQTIFPEIKYDKVDKIRGMNITIVTSAGTDDEAKTLLGMLGMPFKRG